MDIKTNPRKFHDVHHNVEENDLLEVSLGKIKENIKFASPTGLKIYEALQMHEYYEDGKGGYGEDIKKHIIIYFLLDDLTRVD